MDHSYDRYEVKFIIVDVRARGTAGNTPLNEAKGKEGERHIARDVPFTRRPSPRSVVFRRFPRPHPRSPRRADRLA